MLITTWCTLGIAGIQTCCHLFVARHGAEPRHKLGAVRCGPAVLPLEQQLLEVLIENDFEVRNRVASFNIGDGSIRPLQQTVPVVAKRRCSQGLLRNCLSARETTWTK